MATRLEPGKKLKRLVKVYGVEGDVEVTLTHEGIYFRTPRTKLSLFSTWPDAVRGTTTPDNVPSYLAGEPLRFLSEWARKSAAKRQKRAEKKEADGHHAG